MITPYFVIDGECRDVLSFKFSIKWNAFAEGQPRHEEGEKTQ